MTKSFESLKIYKTSISKIPTVTTPSLPSKNVIKNIFAHWKFVFHYWSQHPLHVGNSMNVKFSSYGNLRHVFRVHMKVSIFSPRDASCNTAPDYVFNFNNLWNLINENSNFAFWLTLGNFAINREQNFTFFVERSRAQSSEGNRIIKNIRGRESEKKKRKHENRNANDSMRNKMQQPFIPWPMQLELYW